LNEQAKVVPSLGKIHWVVPHRISFGSSIDDVAIAGCHLDWSRTLHAADQIGFTPPFEAADVLYYLAGCGFAALPDIGEMADCQPSHRQAPPEIASVSDARDSIE
jgi:hypothetical protein